MSDVDRLTIVVTCIGFLIMDRIPERDSSTWGFGRLTMSIVLNMLLTAGVILNVLHIIWGL